MTDHDIVEQVNQITKEWFIGEVSPNSALKAISKLLEVRNEG